MVGFLYKDWILLRKNLLMILVGFCIISIPWLMLARSEDVDAAGVVLFFIFLIIFFMADNVQTASLFAIDERKSWAAFALSSPARARGQAAEKYLLSLLVSLITVGWCAVISALGAAFGANVSGIWRIYCALFCLQTLMRTVEYPFVFRFGNKAGTRVRSAWFYGALCMVMLYLLFGDMSIFGTFFDFFEWIEKLITSAGSSAVVKYLPVLAIPLVLVLYWLSFRISSRFYHKGAERFEQ